MQRVCVCTCVDNLKEQRATWPLPLHKHPAAESTVCTLTLKNNYLTFLKKHLAKKIHKPAVMFVQKHQSASSQRTHTHTHTSTVFIFAHSCVNVCGCAVMSRSDT